MGRLKLRHCIAIWALIGVGLGVSLTHEAKDPDLGWHLAHGKLITESHVVAATDQFSFTHYGGKWIPHEWLSDVLFYSAFRYFGHGGIIILRSLLIFLMVLGLWELIRRRTGDSMVSAFIAALLALAGCSFWSERPQLFTYVFMVVLLNLIDRWRRGASLWFVVPLFALWINLHGGWIAGFAVLTIAVVEEAIVRLRKGKALSAGHLLILLVASAAALFISPLAPGIVTYPLQYTGATVHTRYIDEWQRLTWHMWEFWACVAIAIAVAAACAVGRSRARASEWMLALGSAAAAFSNARHLPIFAILAAPLLAAQLKSIINTPPTHAQLPAREPVALNWMLLLLLPVVIWARFPRHGNQQAHIPGSPYPVQAVSYLQSHPQIGRGRLMLVYNWGGYAIGRLYPMYHVSIDGRADLYGPAAMAAEDRIENLKGQWKSDFAQMNPDVILWLRRLPLTKELDKMPEWRRVYSDDVSVVYVRGKPKDE